jgi:hypothetical protein
VVINLISENVFIETHNHNRIAPSVGAGESVGAFVDAFVGEGVTGALVVEDVTGAFVGPLVGEGEMGAFVGAFVGEGVTGALVGEDVTGAFVGEGVDLADFAPLALLLARVAQQPSKQ